ncbi:hypothetical protein PF010_g19403 [Phytophthora fragariae]|uniref:Uncharacterized protein n=1 Tax=Phytophthora fragariae TaxID=53985 RepID=A0A6A3J2X6_9STRA|nr:hypothetical protein PF011_g18705 [Phytophthora fragariae]KAE9088370.1 hypothetical protein PF010_g19403 [Phytophthora fragariae]KAE9242283.1 hypothetical protein PF004_g6673 [Phytophthora fragariae]
MARERNITELVVVGDPRIVIQQVQVLINGPQPNLQRKLAEYEAMKEHWEAPYLVPSLTKRKVAANSEMEAEADEPVDALASGSLWDDPLGLLVVRIPKVLNRITNSRPSRSDS